jgi:hypothetical protein
MTHEFGHGVGMPHIEQNYVMSSQTPIETDSTKPDFGKFFPDANYKSEFSDSTRTRFTVKVRR